MTRFLGGLLRDKGGVTAIEYGLISALIAVTIIVSVTAVGSNLVIFFNNIAVQLANAV